MGFTDTDIIIAQVLDCGDGCAGFHNEVHDRDEHEHDANDTTMYFPIHFLCVINVRGNASIRLENQLFLAVKLHGIVTLPLSGLAILRPWKCMVDGL